ncbi:type II toxin-antitoxin system RelE/ParE family toxin [Rhodobium gokarnense]|uniref:Toxin ParE1/3/4 n=1 Tax=Rhodobium gokarnense TaxID=364296 RepID=A0ABT3H5U7_9HYPH|nr:type II toxin-antitoxin system RelE/ParE family toxin [Rhodobium gokarnense]MCW2305768.1 toxin ParE1/3/4 [Rhodobium gokarnense]
MPYRLTERAAVDLEDIFLEGILTFGERQAQKYQESLTRIFELIAFLPEIGRSRDPGTGDRRRFVHGTHIIYYRVHAGMIVVERIIYGPLIADPWE